MKKNKTIAFVGSNGLPNKYGGFESFLEAVAPVIAKSGIDVVVTCDPSKYSDREPWYEGVKRIFIPVKANGFRSIPHDFLAFLNVYTKSNAVVFLGVSGAPFLPLIKILAWISDTKIVVNVDGVEWRRDKFNSFTRQILKLFDFFAQCFSDMIVYDNACLINYIYPKFRHKAVLIPYSADHVKRFEDLPIEKGTALTICRIEPENNLELLLTAASRSKLSKYTVVGNWNNSEYGKNLKKRFSQIKNIDLRDPVYDSSIIAKLREQCHIYLHGHSVGGTNPSLIEMLPYRCEVFCFDCSFNRETCAGDADYFDSVESLIQMINGALDDPKTKSRTLQDRYKAQTISKQYVALLRC